MMDSSWQDIADALTQQALQAAERGRWDMVNQCYHERAQLFRENEVPRSLARRLYALDSCVHDRMRMATMSVQHLLTEVALKRRLLERFDMESDVAAGSTRRVSRRA